MKTRLIPVLAVLFATAAVSVAATTPVQRIEIELKNAVALPAGDIRLDQVATLSVPALSEVEGDEPALAEAIASISLGATPLPGNGRSVNRDHIVMHLARNGVDVTAVRWSGPRSCTVTVRSTTVTGDQIVQCAREYLQSLPMFKECDAQIEVDRAPHSKVMAANDGPNGQPTLTASVSSLERPWGNIRVYVKIGNGDKVLATLPVMFRVTCRQKVLYALRPIRKGETLDRAHFEAREIVLGPTSTNESYLTDSDRIVGKKAARAIMAATPLTASMVTEPFAARRGEGISVVLRSRHFEIVAKGTAQSDAYVGDVIPVTIGATGKRIVGKVVSAGTVELTL